MERLLIFLAVLVCIAAAAIVAAMASRGRRPPLRMGSEYRDEDADLLVGSLDRSDSPIDRTAQVLEARPSGRAEPRVIEGHAARPGLPEDGR